MIPKSVAKSNLRIDVYCEGVSQPSCFIQLKKLSQKNKEFWLELAHAWFKESRGCEATETELVSGVCGELVEALAGGNATQDYLRKVLVHIAIGCEAVGLFGDKKLVLKCFDHPETKSVETRVIRLEPFEYLREAEAILKANKNYKVFQKA